jgi:hypothetical protein
MLMMVVVAAAAPQSYTSESSAKPSYDDVCQNEYIVIKFLAVHFPAKFELILGTETVQLRLGCQG